MRHCKITGKMNWVAPTIIKDHATYLRIGELLAGGADGNPRFCRYNERDHNPTQG